MRARYAIIGFYQRVVRGWVHPMRERLERLRLRLISAVPVSRRVRAVLAMGVLAAMLGVGWWLGRPDYRPLFTDLAAHDAAAIVDVLRAEQVPFALADGGRTVRVPAERVHDVRLALASRGLPERAGVGFELFDRQPPGTDFLQRLSYQRALQGELGRTIAGLGGVESARVHLALPEGGDADDRRPSASVVVELARGRTLALGQIDGIVHLVAASVEGLGADAVTVVDQSGRILSRDPRGVASDGVALDAQAAIERQLAARVETMLEAIVGRDKAIARVAATLDPTRVERTEESYDPDRSALRTQRTSRDEAPAETAPASGRRRNETQRWAVSKVVSHTVAPAGTLKQLSVAVVIDGTYVDGPNGVRAYQARPAEELERLRELVKNAVGFSEARGDRVEVTSAELQTHPGAAPVGVVSGVRRRAAAIVAVVLVVGVLALLVRPLGHALARRRGAARPAPLPEGAVVRLTQENVAFARQHPERAAELVREWLRETGNAVEG
ncbi:MAG TPA: flagellar basal-body MS-ring/collar protein FliF [Candidatus Binatia bacterium]|nr:flagellar basal-body MS-ring/collar protein FliF [Candidatus Binatia bacterium]